MAASGLRLYGPHIFEAISCRISHPLYQLQTRPEMGEFSLCEGYNAVKHIDPGRNHEGHALIFVRFLLTSRQRVMWPRLLISIFRLW